MLWAILNQFMSNRTFLAESVWFLQKSSFQSLLLAYNLLKLKWRNYNYIVFLLTAVMSNVALQSICEKASYNQVKFGDEMTLQDQLLTVRFLPSRSAHLISVIQYMCVVLMLTAFCTNVAIMQFCGWQKQCLTVSVYTHFCIDMNVISEHNTSINFFFLNEHSGEGNSSFIFRFHPSAIGWNL